MGTIEKFLVCINKVVTSFYSQVNDVFTVAEILSDPCIFRGENKFYEKVSSSLCRHYKRKDGRWNKLSGDQKEEVLVSAGMEKRSSFSIAELPEVMNRCTELPEAMKRFATQFQELNPDSDCNYVELLASGTLAKMWKREIEKNLSVVDPSKEFSAIQHLGGLTNWIDFTENPLIALFFACFDEEGEESEDGRIIVGRESVLGDIDKPQGRYVNPLQGSVLVRPNCGGEIDIANSEGVKVISIPKTKKKEILWGLERKHGISFWSLFCDIHGYIRGQTHVLPVVKYEEVENPNRGIRSFPSMPLPLDSRTSSISITMQIEKDSE